MGVKKKGRKWLKLNSGDMLGEAVKEDGVWRAQGSHGREEMGWKPCVAAGPLLLAGGWGMDSRVSAPVGLLVLEYRERAEWEAAPTYTADPLCHLGMGKAVGCTPAPTGSPCTRR